MMIPKIKELWCDALESGDYDQCIGSLHEGKAFCGLGVLVNLYGKEKKIDWQESSDEKNVYEMLGESAALPEEVMEWSGLTDDLGDPIVINQCKWTISSHNDGKASFKSIAKAVRAQL